MSYYPIVMMFVGTVPWFLYLSGEKKESAATLLAQMLAGAGYEYVVQGHIPGVELFVALFSVACLAEIMMAERRHSAFIRAHAVPAEHVAGEYCVWIWHQPTYKI